MSKQPEAWARLSKIRFSQMLHVNAGSISISAGLSEHLTPYTYTLYTYFPPNNLSGDRRQIPDQSGIRQTNKNDSLLTCDPGSDMERFGRTIPFPERRRTPDTGCITQPFGGGRRGPAAATGHRAAMVPVNASAASNQRRGAVAPAGRPIRRLSAGEGGEGEGRGRRPSRDSRPTLSSMSPFCPHLVQWSKG